MSVTDIVFVFWFFPISLALYYMVSDDVKEYVLLAVSIVFYACGSLQFLGLFIISIMVTVIIGRSISRLRQKRLLSKGLLICGILYNVFVLGYYKYFDFALFTWGGLAKQEVTLKGLMLPLGISFYTFKAISYIADIYMDRVQMEGDVFHDALYLSMFSQVQSGPLTRYADSKRQESAMMADILLSGGGINRFVIGFCKKVLLANTLSNITTEIFSSELTEISTSYAWLGAVCYSLQIFYDFSGYSDMAIGISELFGYTCAENFDYPYMTKSISQFWRKWHITLGAWFRDYIYIPLGGSRNKHKWRTYLNLFAVWLLTGIWHGASWNFVAWGLGYFVAITIEKMVGLPKRLKTRLAWFTYRIVTLLFINFQWVIFKIHDLGDGLQFIKRMVIYSNDSATVLRVRFLLSDYVWFIAIAVLFCFPVVPWLESKISRSRYVALYKVFSHSIAMLTIMLFLWAVSFVVMGQNNPFVYGNF